VEFIAGLYADKPKIADVDVSMKYPAVVKLIERAFTAHAPTVRVDGRVVPRAEVRQRLLKLTPDLISGVISHVQHCGTLIANIDSYYLACLLRAPDTAELAQYSRDDHADAEAGKRERNAARGGGGR